MTKQIETAILLAPAGCTQSGNALVTVTASGMTNSPKAINVAVLATQTAADMAALIRYALATDIDVSGMFLVSGTGANVVLTARVDAANDTTLNIATDNGTCLGVTPAPTSTNTLAGAATITNGYCTQTEAKAYARITTIDTSDDTILDMLIEAASRYIDAEAQQTFYLATETRLFDLPAGMTLTLDKPLQSITTLTNGDGGVIPSTAYVLEPANDTPKNSVTLLQSSSLGWRGSVSNDVLQCISVAGVWGVACPTDIKEACLAIIKAAYNRRFGENMNSTTTVTQAGLVITPEDVPAKALQAIRNHRRIVFG